MRTFVIGRNDAGQRADKFLLKACPNLPKSLLYKTFRKRDIKCSGKRIPAETFLREGDILQVYLPDDCFGVQQKPAAVQQLPMPEIAYEDENIVLLKKPVNLPVHADDKGSADTLHGRFLAYLTQSGCYLPAKEQSFTPALCNRLDRNTEGFVIGAKNAAALRCMNGKIRSGEITKQYLCITAGVPEKHADTVIAYHRRLPGQKAEIRRQAAEGFSEIRTGYEVLAAHDGLALLLVTLYTGRTHQIRAQTAALGCPVLGDAKYGSPAANKRFGAPHQLLAACRLRFDFSAEPCPLDALRGREFRYVPDFCADFGFSDVQKST
ncbi:MAG: RluA family pseudouridine synthase [Oscillospiraceae bacterium]|nr:RluA family pseudouridine synthase [Oscillospiraceae bacterium]